MQQHDRYLHPHVRICRQCTGHGVVTQPLPLSDDTHTLECPLCLGSGRVRVWGTKTTYVEAYQGRLPFHTEVVRIKKE